VLGPTVARGGPNVIVVAVALYSCFGRPFGG